MEKGKKVKEENKVVKEEKVVTKDYSIEEKSQSRLKLFSKIIAVLSKISEVLLVVGIVLILLAMIVVPIVWSSIKVNNKDNVKSVEIFGKQIIYERTSDKITIYEKDKEKDKTVIRDPDDVEALNTVIDYIEEKDLTKISLFIEVDLILITASLVVMVLITKNLNKLFNNINKEDTPFIEENHKLLSNVGKYLIIVLCISIVIGTFNSLVFNNTLSISMNSTSIIEILVVYCLIYIFEYAYKLQKETKGRIYSK